MYLDETNLWIRSNSRIGSQNDGWRIRSGWEKVLDYFAAILILKCIEYTNALSIAITWRSNSKGQIMLDEQSIPSHPLDRLSSQM